MDFSSNPNCCLLFTLHTLHFTLHTLQFAVYTLQSTLISPYHNSMKKWWKSPFQKGQIRFECIWIIYKWIIFHTWWFIPRIISGLFSQVYTSGLTPLIPWKKKGLCITLVWLWIMMRYGLGLVERSLEGKPETISIPTILDRWISQRNWHERCAKSVLLGSCDMLWHFKFASTISEACRHAGKKNWGLKSRRPMVL